MARKRKKKEAGIMKPVEVIDDSKVTVEHVKPPNGMFRGSPLELRHEAMHRVNQCLHIPEYVQKAEMVLCRKLVPGTLVNIRVEELEQLYELSKQFGIFTNPVAGMGYPDWYTRAVGKMVYWAGPMRRKDG